MTLRWLAPLAFVLTACGTDLSGNPADYDLVVTNPDTTYNFATATTYSLPDYVPILTSVPSPTPSTSPVPAPSPSPGASPGPTPTPTGSPSPYGSVILKSIQDQLNSRGYQQLTDTSGPKPNLFVEAGTMATTDTDVYYSSWYGYYGAYYYPWYGSSIGYGYAPVSTPYVTTSTIGSVFINITNPEGRDATTQKIPSVWIGVLNGYVDAPTSGTVDAGVSTRIQQGIQQAFVQSPYIQKGAP